MSNIIETEKKKSEMLKEVVEKRRNLAQDSLFSQDRTKDLAKDYVQHSICEQLIILFTVFTYHTYHFKRSIWYHFFVIYKGLVQKTNCI